MLIMPLVVGSCFTAAVVSLIVARRRMPKQFRGTVAATKISLTCLGARHMNCDDHLQCPCRCHDVVIHAAIATRWEDALRLTADKNES